MRHLISIVNAGLLSLLLTACAYQRPLEFHELAVLQPAGADYPPDLLLPFDAYVIGVEKDNASRVGTPVECAEQGPQADCLQVAAAYFAQKPELRDKVRSIYADQRRPTFVSHIARFDVGSVPCFVSNDYAATNMCAAAPAGVGAASVSKSWSALAALGHDLDHRLGVLKPTHIIIYTMGWNTPQREALGNFRDLVAKLNDAATSMTVPGSFRPLVIGVTWPSTGSPTISKTDFLIKAKDADEVGAIWINALIHRELLPLKQRHGFKLVVIGHSFGARATSRATFSGPLVSGSAMPTKTVDLLLGLQGAYSYQRFLTSADGGDPDGIEQAPYRDFGAAAGTVALTASQHDTAVTAVGHAKYFAGSSAAYERSRTGEQAAHFVHLQAQDTGLIGGLVCGPERIVWIDASRVIKDPQPGTGGGAHSGIYNQGIGRLTMQLIQRCAS